MNYKQTIELIQSIALDLEIYARRLPPKYEWVLVTDVIYHLRHDIIDSLERAKEEH